jgi:hypothetical protein
VIDLERTLLDAGTDTRATVTASIDIDADLSATLRRPIANVDSPVESPRSRGTQIVVGSAAALVVLLVGALVVIGGDDDEVDPTRTVDTRPESTLAPFTTVDVETSIPESTLPDDTAPTSSTPGAIDANVVLPPQPVVVPVSYLDPPETYEPDVFASIGNAATADGVMGFAVGDGIVAVTGPGPVVEVLDVATGSTTTRSLAVEILNPVFGPGNVLYGLSFTQSTDPQQAEPDAAIVAQPLETDLIAVVDSVVVSASTYTEVPSGTFVAGLDGIYDLDRARGKVMNFVDAGRITTALPTMALPDQRDLPIVRAIDGSGEWIIPVDEDPAAADPFGRPTPPAPGPNGTTRVARFIGPRAETEPVDFGTPTRQVVADLAPGAGRWWSLPDEWRLVTSSSYGTLLARNAAGDRIDLAWFEPDPPPSLPLEPTIVLAADGDLFVAIDRDELGVETRRGADEKVGWPNGCTLDDVEALFALAPRAAVLERLACDRLLVLGASQSTLAAGDFTFNGVPSVVQLVVDDESGPTTEFDDATARRFINMPTTPIVRSGVVSTGDTFPISTPFNPTPSGPTLFEIAADATTPAEFGDEIALLFKQQTPNSEPTSTVQVLSTSYLVTVTQPGGTDEAEETIHYYWLSYRYGDDQLFVDRALQTKKCTIAPDPTACE